ncbi:MAG: hypothetical protein RR998_04435 [Oscillospiraceae bacterium]
MLPNNGKQTQEATEETAERCPSCGGVIEYDIKSGTFRCKSCGNEQKVTPEKQTVDEYSINDYRVRERTSPVLTGVSVARCENCGGEIYFESDETAKRCPMCGSPKIRVDTATSGIAPDGIVPFRVDCDDAQERFRQWIKKRWFAPGLLKKAYGEGALEGLYVPFWTYDADAMADYAGQGGRTRSVCDREGNRSTVTDWFPVSGRVYEKFDDVLVCASKKMSGTVVENVGAYNTISDVKPFAHQYLAGYKAERYSVDGVTCFARAREEMEDRLHSLADSDILSKGFSQADIRQFTARYKDVTYKNVLLPIYTASYGYKGATYGYAVNGQTGRVSGSYPKSAPKIAAAVVLGIAVLLGLMFLFGAFEDSGGNYFEPAYDSYSSDDYGVYDYDGYTGGSDYGVYEYPGEQYLPDDGYYDYNEDPEGYLDPERTIEKQQSDGSQSDRSQSDGSQSDGSQDAA